ncbi:helix-turn-helix transcriptional regulator [Olsenella profusa]|uniref:DNA-binding helix-turn-helix protein n=1 Tax=Olsenella profusa F0195 TaxID=1125712 RepID=U2VAT7_9ACTN|nr:helix-turn-helix transcriptional regulator [Olsenella profusa]ERL09711.1 DNA-binding helix-turn-helix protein [Olsenella profusa F0195]
METVDQKKIKQMQDNLGAIRRVAGWTAEQFGDSIGVTRQTISNLERGKTALSKTQYLAIRTVLNQEIIDSENLGLATVLKALVDEPIEEEQASVEDMEEPRESSAVQTQSAMTKTLASNRNTLKLFASLLQMGGVLTPVVVRAVQSALKNSKG